MQDPLNASAAPPAALPSKGLSKATAGSALRSAVHVAGSDAPEMSEVNVGFMPLTDCASLVMACELGFDRKYGVKINLSKESSWAGVRDKLVGGQLDFAHVLYGLVYGVHMGISGPQKAMAVLMTLNQNGQGLTLSKALANKGATDLAGLAVLIRQEPREYTFAQTFPTGTHAMWLYYWLASAGIHPQRDVNCIVVPPMQMVASLKRGEMDGFSAGEPWNHRAIMDGSGITAATSQDIWQDHPEKVLGATADFVNANPNTARAVTMAVLEASRWIDESPQNKLKMAHTLAGKAYLNTQVEAINPRILGQYQNGLGKTWYDPSHMKFFNSGTVNYPYLSDGMWFLTQHKRWGLLAEHPDYLGVAREINQIALYEQAAFALNIDIPPSPMRQSRLIDGVVWNGSNPVAYTDSFAISASSQPQAHAA